MVQDFDKFLDRVGGFGNYQKRQLFFALTPICFLTALSLFNMFFILHAPMTGCNLHPNTMATMPEGIPFENISGRMTPMEFNEMFYMMLPSSCEQYDYSKTNWTFPGMGMDNWTNKTVSCPAGRWWDTSDWEETLVTKLELVCDKGWTVSFLYSIGMFGQLAILPIASYFQDNFGRKNTMYVMLALYFIFSLCVIWAPSWEVVAFLFFAKQGMGSVGFTVSWLIAIEQCSGDWHTIIMIILCIAFSLSCALSTLIAYFTKSFVTFTLATTIPVLGCFLFWPLLDEPARWYLSHFKLEKARKIMEKMLRQNKEYDQSIMEDLLAGPNNEDENPRNTYDDKNGTHQVRVIKSSATEDIGKYGIWYVFSSGNLIFKTAAIFVTTLGVVMAYYGLMMNSENIGVGNMYIVLGVGYLVEIPAVFAVLACNYVGRVWITGGSLVIGGIFTACVGATTDVKIMIFLVIVAKFFCTIAFDVVYMFAGEIYPTVIRASGIAAAMLGGAVGGIVAPYVIFSFSVHALLPIFLLAGICILGGLTCLLLPETMGREMVDRIEDDTELKAGLGALKENLTFGHLRRRIKSKKANRRSDGQKRPLY